LAHRLTLEVFFPQQIFADEGQDCVDHIDEGSPNNHNVMNLQWMSRAQNSTKGRLNTASTRKDDAAAKSHPIICHNIETGEESKFASMAECERSTGINRGTINYSIKKQSITKGKYRFTRDNVNNDKYQDLPGEEWIRTEIADTFSDAYLMVSNKGRVLTKKGVKTFGTACPRCRLVNVTHNGSGRQIQVHQLVWAMFNNQPWPTRDEPWVDGHHHRIIHTNVCPVDEDGLKLNCPEYLKIE